MSADAKLPVHGFVLAGGKSSRMGRDKALLELADRPLVEIAVEKLRGFCAQVSIAGNRDDLARIAPVVHEQRMECGPAAGVEAGLMACEQPWALFVPVDVPLAPVDFLRRWAVEAMRADAGVSHLYAGANQPAFCMLRREAAVPFSVLLDDGERRLARLLQEAAEALPWACRVYGADALYADGERPDEATLEHWFTNINTPEDLTAVEALLDTDCSGLRVRNP